MHWFGVVQVHRTSSNLLEPHYFRESKVCRVLSHEFGVVRLYRTFSNYGLIVNLFTKGDKEDPENYRGITLLCVVGKVFCKVLNVIGW